MKPRPYIYAVIDCKLRYWNNTGWTTNREKRYLYRTMADAEPHLRKMMGESIHAKIGREK